MSTIYGNPLLIGVGKKSQILQWNNKFSKIVSPGISKTTAPITVKALCYYDGYWYGAGNDSAGDMYKLYGATASALTAVKLASSRKYPVTGITCDGINVWICTSSGAYKDRTILRQPVNSFKSTNTNYNYYTHTNLSSVAFNEICRINDASIGSYVLAAGTVNNMGVIEVFDSALKKAQWRTFGNSGNFVSCCNWNESAVFISSIGYICKYVGNYTNYSGQTLACLQGAKMIRSMNGSLFVACIKSDGTYLYWFKSGADITTSQPTGHIKITDEALTIIGMAYAGGLYTVVGVNSAGAIKVLQSDDAFLTGIYGQSVTLPAGYTPRVMSTDGTNICILADNKTDVCKAMCKIV